MSGCETTVVAAGRGGKQVKGVCSCGWGGRKRDTSARAQKDADHHEEKGS